MEEFEYVTEIKPEEPPPPPPPLWELGVRGLGAGALGGLAFLGVETAVTGWLGLQPAAGVSPLVVGLFYAFTGGLFGGAVGLMRLADGAWALVTMSLVSAWLVSGHLATLMDAGGSLVAILALFSLAILVGYFGGARRLEDPTSGAVAVALFLCFAALTPIDLHLLLTPVSVSGVLWNVGLGVLAAAVGALTGMILADGVVSMIWVISGGAAVAWIAAVPVLRVAHAPWPLAAKTVGPPVVLVVVSGLRADHLGTYGYERPTSPSLDAFAARGVVYGDATTAAPWTLPAMASLLTGRLPSHHDAGTGSRGTSRPLPETTPYLPEVLSRRGYLTVGIATHATLTAPYGFARGFDVYDDRTGPAVMPAAIHPWHQLGLGVAWSTWRSADEITDRALSFLGAQSGGSWFLLVHYVDPLLDLPADPAARAVLGESRGALIDGYDATVREVDAQLGRLLGALPPNAWVVVTASHGIELDERRGIETPDGERWGHSLFQEIVRVPLVVMGPSVQPTWVERPVSAIDVAPTLAWAGGADPALMDGEPLWEVVHTEGTTEAPERPVVVESLRWGPQAKAARQGRYKLVVTQGESERLYDLQLDPRERSPILQRSAELQQVVQKLEATLPPFEE